MIQVQLKLRLRPGQERQLERWLFRLTGVYNWAIRKIEQDAAEGRYYSAYETMAFVNGHGRRVGIPQHVVSATVRQAHEAWRRCFKGLARRPRLKGRRNRLNSVPFSHGNDVVVRDGQVRLHVLGSVRFHRQEIPLGRVGMARAVKRASGWYLCLFIQVERAPIKPIADGEVGIDPGFHRLLTCSTGEIIKHPHELRAGSDRLALAQRGQRRRLTARLLERQANRRKDRNHKLSRRFVEENAVIAWSKDRTSNIARSFGKSVTSAAHSQLRQQIAYKSRAGGRRFVEVDSRNSTRRCSACGALTGPTGWRCLSVRQWTCAACGAEHERDVNAARNTLIAALGTSVESSCEATSGIATRALRRGSFPRAGVFDSSMRSPQPREPEDG